MFDFSSFDALEWVAFALPLLILPALIITALLVQTPILRREPATARRRVTAKVLAILSLIAAAPLLAMVWALGAFGLLLLGGLTVPAILTLTRLHQPPPITGTPPGTE